MTARQVFTSEVDLIRQIQEFAGQARRVPPQVRLSIGDDAAAFQLRHGMLALLSMDALVEGVHFDLNYFTPEDLGWKSLAVNLSDIAAMGGKPLCFATSIALPKQDNRSFIRKLYRGMMDLANRYGVVLVGGDTCASPREVFLDLVIIGEVKPADIVRRAGAQPGDSIFVSGELGGSAMGLELLKSRGRQRRAAHVLAKRHLRPVPRCELGQLLAQKHLVSAMIDLSDGLSTDLYRLCESSQVGAVIEASRIPIAPIPAGEQSHLDHEVLHYAVNGGEDYELLFTVPSSIKNRVPHFLGEIPLREIGRITKEVGKSWIQVKGHIDRLYPGGFDHFVAH
jgi:thiamine-monophosphate kinase